MVQKSSMRKSYLKKKWMNKDAQLNHYECLKYLSMEDLK